MCGPHHCPGRDAFASGPEILRRLLQPFQNASVFEQGCTGLSLGTAHRCHSFRRHPGRTSSPLWSGLGFSVHTPGFRCYWRWKSRPQGGRPQIDTELRVLIRRMSMENPLWGAPRIHGALLKLGFEVAQSSVAKYIVKRRGPPSQGWRTFLRNHAPDIAAMDLFVVPTIGFDLLYALVIVRLDRRELVWISVTTHPTAEWVARHRSI